MGKFPSPNHVIYQCALVPITVCSVSLWTKHMVWSLLCRWFEHTPLLHSTLTCLAWCECVGLRIGLSVGRLAAPITERSRVQTLAAVSRGGERDNAHEGQESGLSSVFILSRATERIRGMLE